MGHRLHHPAPFPCTPSTAPQRLMERRASTMASPTIKVRLAWCKVVLKKSWLNWMNIVSSVVIGHCSVQLFNKKKYWIYILIFSLDYSLQCVKVYSPASLCILFMHSYAFFLNLQPNIFAMLGIFLQMHVPIKTTLCSLLLLVFWDNLTPLHQQQAPEYVFVIAPIHFCCCKLATKDLLLPLRFLSLYKKALLLHFSKWLQTLLTCLH